MFIEPVNPEKGQIPVSLEVSTKSLVNGSFTPNPIVNSGDDWILDLNIQELEYDPAFHQHHAGSYEKLFGRSSNGISFINKLKQEIEENRLKKKI